MAKLYVANTTNQRQIVMYRLDFNSQGEADPNDRFRAARSAVIEPGRQIVLGGDLHIRQIESIIDQLSRVGGLGINEVARPPGETTVAYLLSTEKPVSEHHIRSILAHNQGFLRAQGAERRAAAAVAANAAVEMHLQEPLPEFKLEIEQQAPDPGDPDPGKLLEEGFTVKRPADGSPPPAPRMSRKQARRANS
jgi:hypothetical protein